MSLLERHRRGILVLYLVGLLALTLTPISIGTGDVGALDKVAHTLLFAALAVLLYWNFLVPRRSAPGLMAAVVATGFAGLVELLQMRVPERHGDADDFFAGLLGAWVAAIVVRTLVERRSEPEPGHERAAPGRHGRPGQTGQSEEAGSS